MIKKNDITVQADSDELKLILSHACDLYNKADVSGRAFFTKFLTPADAADIEKRFPKNDVPVSFFGGYDEAERKIAVFGDVYDKSEYPVCAVRVRQKGGRELNHRDYLGTVLSLGLKREMVGDIIVESDGAIVFCLEEIGSFIADSLVKIANSGVEASVVSLAEFEAPKRKYEQISATVSSLRLDCVVSAAAGKARSAAAQLISRSMVSLNYKECESVSKNVCDGDVLTVRGIGKFLIKTDGRLTKKGRIHIELNKYV